MATVLVVDDEYGIVDLLEGVLTDAGHEVVLAANGRDALERFAEATVDVVLSDLMMPVMDGAGLLAALRADKARDSVPFVLMCALPEASIADRIAGYDGFLRKPFRIDAVLGAIDKVLADRAARAAAGPSSGTSEPD